ncbi:MAG: hypothetical protein MJ002_04905 [Paludibacteraceae bacterium]|nr:hypothetical protein [Paludibacteraceae bacterium]
MKKVLLAAATVAMLFATSCKKDVNAPENIQLGENEFLATIDNGAVPQNAPAVRDGMNTMATIDGDRRVFWEESDHIAINGCEYMAETYGNPVKFTPVNPNQVAEGNEFHAFYPASIASEGPHHNGTLPEVQIYTADNNASNLPMYAYSDNKQLTFHNICAVLKIEVPADFAGATKIEASSDQIMNGGFSISNPNDKYTAVMDGNEYAEYVGDEFKKVSIRKSDYTPFVEDEVVYIAVPAQEYTNLRVEFFNGDNTLWHKTLDKCTLEVNKIYNINMTPLEYLCFEALEDGSAVKFDMDENNFGGVFILYNLISDTYDDERGVFYDPSELYDDELNPGFIPLNAGDKVYFWAENNHNESFPSQNAQFVISGRVKASGNIMSLYGPGCPDNFTLPDDAFNSLFAGCSGLTEAPELPATKLSNNCYNSMFKSTGLTKAPKLPAKQLAENCYKEMFNYCPDLNEVWIYATDGFNEYDCLTNWLNDAGSESKTIHCTSAAANFFYDAGSDYAYSWIITDDLP